MNPRLGENGSIWIAIARMPVAKIPAMIPINPAPTLSTVDGVRTLPGIALSKTTRRIV